MRELILLTLLSLLVTSTDFTQTIQEFHPNIKWGGRMNAITRNPVMPNIILVAGDGGGIFKSTNSGERWAHVDNFPSFLVRDIAYLDGFGVIATTSTDTRTNSTGIWISKDNGGNWNPVSFSGNPTYDMPAVANGICIDQQNSRIYIATTSGLVISSDNGDTWTLDPELQIRWINAVQTLADNTILVAGQDGLFRKDPVNNLWTESINGFNRNSRDEVQNSNGDVKVFAVSPLNPKHVYYVRGAREFFESYDAGINWSQVDRTGSNTWINGRPPFIKTVKSYTENNKYYIYYFQTVTIFKRTVIVSGTKHKFVETEWNDVGSNDHNANIDGSDILFEVNSDKPFLLTADGGIYKWRENELKWYSVGGSSKGLNGLQLYDVAEQMVEDPLHSDIYYGTQDNGFGYSTDNGNSWNDIGSEGGNIGLRGFRQRESSDSLTFFDLMWGENKVSGEHFTGIRTWNNAPGGILFEAALNDDGTPRINADGETVKRRSWISKVFHISDRIFVQNSRISSDRNTLFITYDFGNNWEKLIEIDENFSEEAYPPEICLIGNNNIYLYYSVLKTKPGGNNLRHTLVRINILHNGNRTLLAVKYYPEMMDFGSLEGTSHLYNSQLAVDPANPYHLIASDAESKQIKTSSDGGDTWLPNIQLTERITNNNQFVYSKQNRYQVQVRNISFDPSNPNRVLLCTSESGIFFSNDNGNNWTVIDNSNKCGFVTNVRWAAGDSKIAYLSTFGRGLWKIIFPGPSFQIVIPDVQILYGHGTSFIEQPLRIYPDFWDRLVVNKKFEIEWLPWKQPIPKDMIEYVRRSSGCITTLLVDGKITDIETDINNKVKNIYTNINSKVISRNKKSKNGKQLRFKFSDKEGKYSSFPVLKDKEKSGKTIVGVICEKGKVLGVLTAKAPLAASDYDLFRTDKNEFIDDKSPMLFIEKGTSISFYEKTVTLYGKNFVFENGLVPNVSISINDKIIYKDILPGKNGSFAITLPLTGLLPNHYTLTAKQHSGEEKTNTFSIVFEIVRTLDAFKENEK